MTLKLSAEVVEATKKGAHTVLVPVCPKGDAHFAATVVFDLMRLQVDPEAIVRLPDYAGYWLQDNSLGAAVALVWSEGRRIYVIPGATFVIKR